MGGIVGIIFGTIGSVVLGRIIYQQTIYPVPWVTIAAFALSVALGVLFGSYPAIKASKLQPVEALRAGSTSLLPIIVTSILQNSARVSWA